MSVWIPNHETRITAFTVHRPSDISSGANQSPANGFHGSRDTKHETRLFPKHESRTLRRSVRRGREKVAQPTAAAWTAAPAVQSLLSCAPSRGMARQSCCLLTASLVTAISHAFPQFPTKSRPSPPRKGPRRVRPSRSASRRAPFAAAPVSLRVAFAADIARWTHAEKGQRSGLHEQGNFLYCVDRKKGLTSGETRSTIGQHHCM